MLDRGIMPSAYIRPLSGDCQRFLIDGYLKGYIIEDDNKEYQDKGGAPYDKSSSH